MYFGTWDYCIRQDWLKDKNQLGILMTQNKADAAIIGLPFCHGSPLCCLQSTLTSPREREWLPSYKFLKGHISSEKTTSIIRPKRSHLIICPNGRNPTTYSCFLRIFIHNRQNDRWGGGETDRLKNSLTICYLQTKHSGKSGGIIPSLRAWELEVLML